MMIALKGFNELADVPEIHAREIGRTLARCQLNDGCHLPIDSIRQIVLRNAAPMARHSITPAMVMASEGYRCAVALAPDAVWNV